MKCQSFPCVAAVFALALAWTLASTHAADETVLDTATIEAITGHLWFPPTSKPVAAS